MSQYITYVLSKYSQLLSTTDLGVAQRAHVEGVRVLLAAALVVVVDHVVSDVLLGGHEGLSLFVASLAHVQRSHHWKENNEAIC